MYNLKEIMCEVYRQDFAEFDNPPKHHFSRRSRKKLNGILYPKSPQPAENIRRIAPSKRIIIALLIIILMAVGITAGAAISRGFTRKEHRDNTELFTVNAENAPKTIENVYYLPIIPDGYELYEQTHNSRNVFTDYINNSVNSTLSFDQCVKEDFTTHFDNERYSIEEMEVDGKYALYYENNGYGIIVWDNEDYILEISGNFAKDELLNLAKSAKV